MNDFDNRFKARRDRFDKDFDRMQKMAYVVFFVNLFIAIALISGVVFVVYKILAHFGIL